MKKKEKDNIENKDTIKEKKKLNLKLNKIRIRKKENKSDESEKRVITFSLVEMIIIVILVSLVVGVVSGFLVYKNYDFISNQTNNSNTSTSRKDLQEFTNLYDELMEKYYKDIDSSELIDSAIDGMLNYLDLYTDYLDEDVTSELQTRLDGEYEGIGVEISQNKEGNVVIVTVFDKTPAEDAGLKPGDIISAINGKSVLGSTSSEVASTIKGSTATNISITYIRDEKEHTVEINLSNVLIPSVSAEVYDNNIGYLGISTFSATTYSQVKSSLEDLKKDNIKSLIIDVRDNTGGYLSAAKSIADLFLEKGKVIYQLQYKDGSVEKFEATTKASTDYEIVVLINGNSASASEILAAALKESYGAKLLGTTSFGKGTVQEKEILSTGAMIKYTSAYWLTPNGNCINEVGLKPDIEVEQSTESDSQLQAAMEALQ